MADRARSYERRIRVEGGVASLAERFAAAHGTVVQDGPFRGLAYPRSRLAEVDAAVAKLAGSYERELAPVFERAIERRIATFVDIGSADGYYAAGMAAACPSLTSHAYDIASTARDLCAATARASAVAARVRVNGRFTWDALPPSPDLLVLCDIEGGEVELLDAAAAERLAHALIVVEVHEDERPGAGARLRDAFAATHDAETIQQQPRNDVGALADWPEPQRRLALSEFRGPLLHWLVFRPSR